MTLLSTPFPIAHKLRVVRRLAIFLILSLAPGYPRTLLAQEFTAQCPPPARVDSAKDAYGATIVGDPYRWLEDQDSPETRAWISAEQKCTEGALSKLPGRAELGKRLAEGHDRPPGHGGALRQAVH